MTQNESAIDEIAGRMQGTDASLTSSIADILAAALQERVGGQSPNTLPTGCLSMPGSRVCEDAVARGVDFGTR